MTDHPTKKKSGGIGGGLGLGLAFIVGVLTFFVVLGLMRHFMSPPAERLTPPSERPGGALAMPVYGGGKDWDLAEHRGRVVLVNYFATWCIPCIEETPAFKAVARDYASKGVMTVGVSLDHDNEREQGVTRDTAVAEFVKQFGIIYPVLQPGLDSVQMRNTVPIPQTALYDKLGRRALHIMGPVTEAELRQWLNELVAE